MLVRACTIRHVRCCSIRHLSTARPWLHENPLGLPRAGTPPNLARRMQRGLPEQRRLPGVKKIIAIASAKGGVGKSTVSVNLALSFARLGYKTGLLDTDIFGPSVPKLLNLSGEPELSDNNQLLPMQNYGVKAMSMGFLMGQDSAVVWRGMMVMKALQQLLHEVAWGDLDILILDMPPGTGDVQLTITQQLILDGAVVVSTPQDIALLDAVRGITMFEKTRTKVLGMVQNMSHFVCPKCGEQTDIFGTDGVVREAGKHGMAVLGDIPLHASICKQADLGKPTVVSEPDGVLAKHYLGIADKIAAAIHLHT